MFSTEVAPQQVLVMEQDIKAVRERGHRICTSLQQGNRVLQPVFHSSKEGWGLRPILDLRVLNDSVMQLKFKILNSNRDKSCHRSDPRTGLSR